MGKSNDYDYDQITSKLMKKAPKVIKGQTQPPIGDIYEMMGPASPKESTKNFKYVPQKTDTDENMKAPPNFSYEEVFNDNNFINHMNNSDYTKINKGMNMEHIFQDRILQL